MRLVYYSATANITQNGSRYRLKAIVVINVYKRLFLYKNAFLTFFLFFERFYLKNVELSV